MLLMGHRLSKSNWTSSSSPRNLNLENNTTQASLSSVQILTISKPSENLKQRLLSTSPDLKIEKTISQPISTLTPASRFIIRIELTKMEPGNHNNNQFDRNIPSTNATTLNASITNENRICANLDNNLNINKPIINLTITKNILCDAHTMPSSSLSNDQNGVDSTTEIKLNNLNRTIGDNVNNLRNFTNNFTTNRQLICLNSDDPSNENNISYQFDDCRNSNFFNTSSSPALLTVANDNSNNTNNNITSNSNKCNSKISNLNSLPINNCCMASTSVRNNTDCLVNNNCNCSAIQEEAISVPVCNDNMTAASNDCNSGHVTLCAVGGDDRNHCCRRKKSSSTYPTTLRCCKCVCLETRKTSASCSTTSLFESKESSSSSSSSASSSSSSSKSANNKRNWTTKFNCTRRNSSASLDRKQSPKNNNVGVWSVSTDGPSPCVQQHLFQTLSRGGPNVIVLSVSPESSHFVVGSLEDIDEDRGLQLSNNRIDEPIDMVNHHQQQGQHLLPRLRHILCTSPGLMVHSQADYVHCLVPDLEKITSSSFYWGKMDRYEAERLLEGKPEGTFLLRDSAQEEYLFSVTFRKYGRSLHARIEQYNHQFSFDCHDPGVFTAPTVTGLLEHYKDPSCVMFFEPMLTIPLHRNFSFSLQQLCRATIVSSINYDGINELQLPTSLKAYLKEYHYKFRVRVKPFDESFYTCS